MLSWKYVGDPEPEAAQPQAEQEEEFITITKKKPNKKSKEGPNIPGMPRQNAQQPAPKQLQQQQPKKAEPAKKLPGSGWEEPDPVPAPVKEVPVVVEPPVAVPAVVNDFPSLAVGVTMKKPASPTKPINVPAAKKKVSGWAEEEEPVPLSKSGKDEFPSLPQ